MSVNIPPHTPSDMVAVAYELIGRQGTLRLGTSTLLVHFIEQFLLPSLVKSDGFVEKTLFFL
jgi:hypothetical protein